MTSRKHLIIGAGSAGLSAVAQIRRVNKEGEIKLLTMDDFLPYSPASLPYLLSGKMAEADIWIRDEMYFKRLGCTLLKGKKVGQVVPEKNIVVYDDETSESYDVLLIASGSESIKPSIKGLAKVGVHNFCTLSDCRRLLRELERKNRVVILGAGMAGMKIATALLERGCQVSIVEKEEKVLPLYFDEGAEKYIKEIFTEHKARFFMGKTVENLDRKGGKIVIALSDGDFLDADIFINCIGTKSRTSFLLGKGFKINKGICVDERMSTGFDNVYAAGDVVEVHDFFTRRVRPSANIHNASAQGRVAGANMVGGDAKYEGVISLTAFHFFGNQAFSIGLSMSQLNAGEVWKGQDNQSRKFKKLVFKDDRLVGAMFLNEKIDPGTVFYLIRRRVDIRAHKEALQERAKSLSDPWLSSLRIAEVDL